MSDARKRLQAAILPLQQFIATGGPEKEAGWLRWLELPELESQLNAAHPDVVVLADHLQRLNSDRAGLELPPFVELRRELQQFMGATEFTAAEMPADLFHQRLKELNDCLARLDAAPNAQDANRAGRLVAWLESLGGESAALAAAVRQEYCRTNAIGQISARFVNLMLERNVETQQFIAERMLGSFTQGVAFTRANVSVGFVPSREHATLELRMQGQTTCPANVAQRRRISVHTSADTTIRANKQVFIDGNGFELAPAAASTSSSVQINAIDAGRLVERLAWRRAGRMTPQAEAAVSERAQVEASRGLDQQAAAGLAGINNMFHHQMRAPLIRRDALPRDWQFWTDRDHLRISLAQHNDLQLAAASPVPQFSTNLDVAAGAHESMVVNLAEALVRGETIEDHRWLEFTKHVVGHTPPALCIHDHSPRWSVTLASELPLLVRFADERIALTVRLAKVSHGSSLLERPIEIEARYLTHIRLDGPVMLRDGPIIVRLAKPAPSEEWESMQSFLAEKFDEIIPAQVYFHGMSPPAGGALDKLNLLDLAEFKSTGGWVTMAFYLRPQDSQSSQIASVKPD